MHLHKGTADCRIGTEKNTMLLFDDMWVYLTHLPVSFVERSFEIVAEIGIFSLLDPPLPFLEDDWEESAW